MRWNRSGYTHCISLNEAPFLSEAFQISSPRTFGPMCSQIREYEPRGRTVCVSGLQEAVASRTGSPALLSKIPSANFLREIFILLHTRWDEHTLSVSNMFWAVEIGVECCFMKLFLRALKMLYSRGQEHLMKVSSSLLHVSDLLYVWRTTCCCVPMRLDVMLGKCNKNCITILKMSSCAVRAWDSEIFLLR